MTRGPVLVLVAGCATFAVALLASVEYVDRGHSNAVPFGLVRGAMIEAQERATDGGFVVRSRHSDRPTEDSLPFGRTALLFPGECALVIGGSAGGREVAEVTIGPPERPWWRRGERAHVLAPPDRLAVSAMHCAGPQLERVAWAVRTRSRSEHTFDREHAVLRATVLVGSDASFDPPSIAHVRRLRDGIEAHDLAIASLASVFVLMLGTMVTFGTNARRELFAQETLRSFKLALPATMRGELEDLVHAAGRGGAPAVRRLRAALLDRVPHVHAANYQRWTGTPDAVVEHRSVFLERARSIGDVGRDRGYRHGDEGFAVLTLVIRHRVELPDLPVGIGPQQLEFALDAAIPRDDRELVSVDAFWQPGDRSRVLAPEQLGRSFPELVPLDRGAPMACPACEAPRQPSSASCPGCGSVQAASALFDH